ncbi:tol-pal system protein YbgF [Lichenibacterium minor]|uniref:Cell division coordinator CpoB n=1 Tax=Lichenibacterium minor TaxID=2316528 RepID=A0A4Q2U8L5_9HYPH|nr:tol-pal system protein YbgF [Lichenibacterium minor]RYC33089.1 tol-pal system protein YbgF [Lichenibacterium minor]
MKFSVRSLLTPAVGLACAALMVSGAGPGRAAAGERLAAPPIVLAQDDPDAAPDPSSAAALLVRVDRLENKLRSLTGQIEQLQNQNRRLEDALRKMQQDVDFRFQDLNRAPVAPGGKPPLQRHGDLGDASPDALADATPAAPAAAVPASPAAPAASQPRRGDAFDPASDPNAPGAPRPLGATAGLGTAPPLRPSVPPAAAQPHAPLDLTHGATPAAAPPAVAAAEPPAALRDEPVPAPAGGVASLAPGSTRGEYEADYALYKGAQYDGAIAGFNDFLNKYPRDRLVPDATYFLGESYARLGRHREAAEQFLKLSTDYTKSNRAPDALLRLGMALNALGAGAQACATYQEVDRKYPAAGADVRTAVDRELKRAHC